MLFFPHTLGAMPSYILAASNRFLGALEKNSALPPTVCEFFYSNTPTSTEYLGRWTLNKLLTWPIPGSISRCLLLQMHREILVIFLLMILMLPPTPFSIIAPGKLPFALFCFNITYKIYKPMKS